MEVQTKGGFVWLTCTTVILTSNFDPATLYTARDNPWSVHESQPIGPFQRRFSTGGIIKGTGDYKKGTAQWSEPLPIRDTYAEIHAAAAAEVRDMEAAPDSDVEETPPEDYDAPMTDLGGNPGLELGAPVEPMTPSTYIDVEQLLNDIF